MKNSSTASLKCLLSAGFSKRQVMESWIWLPRIASQIEKTCNNAHFYSSTRRKSPFFTNLLRRLWESITGFLVDYVRKTRKCSPLYNSARVFFFFFLLTAVALTGIVRKWGARCRRNACVGACSVERFFSLTDRKSASVHEPYSRMRDSREGR